MSEPADRDGRTDRIAAADGALDELVAAVAASAKYRSVCETCVRRIGARELARRGSLKEAVKATKNQLHQVAGAYLAGKMPYGAWLSELRAARTPEALEQACRRIMASHVSTRERLPILSEFYRAIFAALPPVRTVVDIACGLNPLALPWMPLAAGAEYYAYDLFTDMMAFIGQWLAMRGVGGRAEAVDVTIERPNVRADLALVLKVLPCLDQLDRSAAADLLDGLAARHIVVSFPARSLGGRAKGMATHYAERFGALADDRPWRVERIEFPGELVFIIDKGEPARP